MGESITVKLSYFNELDKIGQVRMKYEIYCKIFMNINKYYELYKTNIKYEILYKLFKQFCLWLETELASIIGDQ